MDTSPHVWQPFLQGPSLKVCGYTTKFSIISSKRDNFCDFLVASLFLFASSTFLLTDNV